MGLFLKRQKVFICHERVDGIVSADAVLLKRLLDKIKFLDVYMDVEEYTVDKFPEVLNEKIRMSNSFVFLIPFNGDVSFLKNPDGWTYKEISDAKLKYDLMPVKFGKKTFQFLPVSFSNSFEWPNDLPEDISWIREFDRRTLNLNDKTDIIQKKLVRALRNRAHRSINWWGCTIFTILVALTVFWGVRHTINHYEYKTNEERVEYMKESFQRKIDKRIQPVFNIPLHERTPLEDSIYRFFEQRDQFYYVVQMLPIIKNTGIERNDDFTTKTIKRVYDAYTTSTFASINDLNRLSSSFSYLNHKNNFDTSIDGMIKQYQVKSDESLKQINRGFKYGNVRKSFKAAIRLTDCYEFWEIIDRVTNFYEETANMCNMILDHK